MSLKDKATITDSQKAPSAPRWKQLLDLPPHTVLRDISTGCEYLAGQLEPLYRDHCSNVVETFRVRGSQDTVHVPFLRRKGDGLSCRVGGAS